MSTVTMKDLLEAGVHFGHQTRRWNPKMRPYIFTERNGIYIVDLQRTLKEIQTAYEFVRDIAARDGKVLLVGTKKQAQEPIEREAVRAGMPYVNHRWLGGMLTNWATIKTRIGRLEELEGMRDGGSYDALPKKEVLKLEAEREKLNRNLSGIRDMGNLPDAVFIVDTRREIIPVAEARNLNIPIIAIVDTNCDPDEVDYVIPGNDDAIRSVSLMCRVIGDACVEGKTAAGIPIGSETEEVAEAPAETAEPTVAAEAPAPAPAAPEADAVATETAEPAAADAPAETPIEEAPVEEAPVEEAPVETAVEPVVQEAAAEEVEGVVAEDSGETDPAPDPAQDETAPDGDEDSTSEETTESE